MNTQIQDSLPAQPIEQVLNGLNDQQLPAATSDAKNIMVVAGAGTGKTKTMEARVAYLVDNDVDPKRILALSFTNESSKEFEGRIKDTCGYAGHLVLTGTFHAYFNRVLRINSGHDFFKQKLGYNDGFFIIDDDDMKKLMAESMTGLPNGLGKLAKAMYKPKEALSALSILRSKCFTARTFANTLVKDKDLVGEWSKLKAEVLSDDSDLSIEAAIQEIRKQPKLKDFLLVTVWDAYSQRCRTSNAMDFDDVLLNTYFLFKFNPDICRKVAFSLDHLLVDEYQDTNVVQAMIIKLLKDQNPALSLFIVGDGRQAIYDFRGSDVSLMTNADRYFGDFQQYELRTNYRSSETVIAASNIFAKNMVNQRTEGQLECGIPSIPVHPMEGHVFTNDLDEAEWVMNSIQQQLSRGVPAEEIYVIYRNRTAARSIESLMQKNHMQFEMVGERDFYECADVRDALAFLRTIARPKDILAWSRLCRSMPVPIRPVWLRDKHMQSRKTEEGRLQMPKDLILSRATGKNANGPIEEWIRFYDDAKQFFDVDEEMLLETFMADEVPSDVTLKDVKYLIETDPNAANEYTRWKHSFIDEVVTEVCELFIERVLPAYAKDDATEKAFNFDTDDLPEKTLARVDRIRIVFDELTTRLKLEQPFVDIVDDLLTRDAKRREGTAPSVKLLTGHASKGLEAKICYVVGCDTAIWQQAKELTEKDMDEAARLYYVMSSRAKEKNYFTFANSRFMYDKTVPSKPFKMIHDHLVACEKAQVLSMTNHATPVSHQSHRAVTQQTENNIHSSNEVLATDMTAKDAQRFRSNLQARFASITSTK